MNSNVTLANRWEADPKGVAGEKISICEGLIRALPSCLLTGREAAAIKLQQVPCAGGLKYATFRSWA